MHANQELTEYLVSGNAALTRAVINRCKKENIQFEEDTQWTKYGKKRIGIYAPASVIQQEGERLKETEEKRLIAKKKRQERDIAKFVIEILRDYPSCPEPKAIAQTACKIGSGRVGRSSTADDPIRAAVIAHIRHCYTDYDDLLEEGYNRDTAREAVSSDISTIVKQWEQPVEKMK